MLDVCMLPVIWGMGEPDDHAGGVLPKVIQLFFLAQHH
jgi:hypothetical protein